MLKLVFEWCRIHIKTVFAQHYSLVVFYTILLWFTYAWFIQENPVQVGPGPPKSAQVLPGPGNLQPFPPRFSQEFPEVPQNRRKYHPGSPRKSRNPHKTAENTTQNPGNPHKTAENTTQVLPGHPGTRPSCKS